MLRVSSDCSPETHAEKKSFDVMKKNKTKKRETLSVGSWVPKSPGKGGEGGLEDRTRLKRKRKERERKVQLAHPLNRPRGHGRPGAVFGEIHPSVSISFIQCCDWLVASLVPRAHLLLAWGLLPQSTRAPPCGSTAPACTAGFRPEEDM